MKFKGASCGQHSALSTQHSALSTQHSALSTQFKNKQQKPFVGLLFLLICSVITVTGFAAEKKVTGNYFIQGSDQGYGQLAKSTWFTTEHNVCTRPITVHAGFGGNFGYEMYSEYVGAGVIPWTGSDARDGFECRTYIRNTNEAPAALRVWRIYSGAWHPYIYVCPYTWPSVDGFDFIAVQKDHICETGLVKPTLYLTPAPNQKDPRPKGTEGKDPKSSTYELIAKVMEGSTPKAGVAVTFAVEVEPNTGGHDHHDVSRPKGLVNGALTASGVTEANGEIKVTFQASQIAGTHVVAAVCESCTNKSVTKNVDVKVPDLVPFLALPFRTQQWNPSGIGWTVEHSDNHYLTVAATYRLLEIAAKYKKIWPTAPTLTLNDGSLKWGGKFDIPGTWERNPKKHNEHRIGDNIDIRSNDAPGAVPKNIREAVMRWLQDASTTEDDIEPELVIKSVDPLREFIGLPLEHFHLRLGN